MSDRQGADISVAGRLVAIADAYDVMTSARSYKKPLSPELARQELTACAGAQFDPAMVRAFLQIGLGRLKTVAGPLAWLANLTGSVQLPTSVTSAVTGPAWSAGVAAIGMATASLSGLGPEPASAPPEELAFVAPLAAANIEASGLEGEAIELTLVAQGSDQELQFSVGGPAHGSVSQPAGAVPATDNTSWATSVTYVPNAGFVGGDGFSFEACSEQGECAIGNVSLLVERLNSPPVAGEDTASVDAGASVAIDVLENDSDPDGIFAVRNQGQNSDLRLVSVDTPQRGEASIVGKVILYRADPTETGPVTFDYVIADRDDAEATGLVTVEVRQPPEPSSTSLPATTTPPTSASPTSGSASTIPAPPPPSNSSPSAQDNATSTPEDTAVVVDVLGNDSDPDGDPLSIFGVGTPLHGVTSVVAGEIRYSPAANYHGADQFTYTVTDSVNMPIAATVTLVVTAVNDAPTAAVPDMTIDESAAIGSTVVVVAAADVDGDSLSFAISTGNGAGHFAIDGSGAITVMSTLDHETNASYALEISVSDGTTTTAANTTVTIGDVDEPPDASDDTDTTNEDTTFAIAIGANDVDPEAGPLTWNVPASSTAGATLSEANGIVTYVPVADYSGTDTFSYTVTDTGGSSSAPATVTVVVSPVNDVPVAADDTGVGYTTPEDTPITTADVTINDTDVDHAVDQGSVALLAGPANGAAVGNGNGTFTYTPDLNYVGIDGFTYTITDPAGGTSNPAVVTINVTGTNDPPLANDDNGAGYTTLEDTPLNTPDITANDSDLEDGATNPATVAVVTPPTNGAIANNGDGTFTYSPNLNWSGTDAFTYTVYDTGLLLSNTATVTINVTSVNDPPEATADSLTIETGAAGTTVDVRLNDTDVEGGALTIVAVGDGTNGTTIDNGNGTITYTHDGTPTLSDSFTYTVADTGGLQDTAAVTVSIAPPEDNDAVAAAVDNCPLDFNPEQMDTDNDGVGDACDPTPTSPSSALYASTGQDLGSGKSLASAVADVDDDGDLDVIYANRDEPNTIWLNNGTGTFTNSGQALGTLKSVAVAAADLDGDSDIDLAFANNANEPNTIWLNDGTGAYTDTGQTLGAASSEDVAVGDLDGDGDLDLAFANSNEPNRVWFNDGAGTYTDTGQTLGTNKGSGIAVGDIDNDGDLDLLFAHDGDDNTIWLNNGLGVFTDSGQSLGSGRSHDPAFADLDNDGDLDLAMAEDDDGDSVWLNNGAGVFTDTGQVLGLGHSRALAIGDFDGDGDLDIALGAHIGPNSIWLNDGAGVFTDSGQRLANNGTEGLTTGDLNNDGTLDLIIANDDDPNLIWLNS